MSSVKNGVAQSLLAACLQAFDREIQKQRLTQAQVAQTLGCSPSYVSRLLNENRNLTFNTAAKLLESVGATAQDVKKFIN